MIKTEAKAEVKELIQDVILITYDLPAKEKHARTSFLKSAFSIGAIQHTESCYLLPFSEKAFGLANKLKAIGDVIIWKSRQEDLKMASEITMSYSSAVQARCQTVEQRLVIAQDHLAAGRLGMAKRVKGITGKLLAELWQINETFTPDWLKPKLLKLAKKYKEVHGG